MRKSFKPNSISVQEIVSQLLLIINFNLLRLVEQDFKKFYIPKNLIGEFIKVV